MIILQKAELIALGMERFLQLLELHNGKVVNSFYGETISVYFDYPQDRLNFTSDMREMGALAH